MTPSLEPLALRPYQTEVINRVRREVASGKRSVLIVAPTGAGKTVIASSIIGLSQDTGARVLFLAHRRELIKQASNKLFPLDHGIIQAGFPPRPEAPIQVASVPSLWSRAFRSMAMDRPPADLIIVDEAHRACARTYQQILDAYPDATILGLTATPCRGDGRGLGNIFDCIVECPGVRELVDLGFLVPTRVYAPTTPDLKGVGTAQGDYVAKQLATRMDQPELIGDIAEHWHRFAEGRKTVVFATSVGHSLHIRNEFRRTGILAEHIDGSTPLEQRDEILAGLSAGTVDLVTNYAVLQEGWDQPDVSCCVLARPTKQMGLYRQMVGRVLRPALGKIDALVLDHAGAVFKHGFVHDPVFWTLDTDKRATNPVHASRGKGQMPGLAACPECSAIRMQGRPCVVCGWRPQRRAETVEVADGELGRVDSNRLARQKSYSREDKRDFYCGLAWIARERGYKSGWVYYKFLEKFAGEEPALSWKSVAPIAPDPSVRSWVRSRQIAYAKGREK